MTQLPPKRRQVIRIFLKKPDILSAKVSLVDDVRNDDDSFGLEGNHGTVDGGVSDDDDDDDDDDGDTSNDDGDSSSNNGDDLSCIILDFHVIQNVTVNAFLRSF